MKSDDTAIVEGDDDISLQRHRALKYNFLNNNCRCLLYFSTRSHYFAILGGIIWAFLGFNASILFESRSHNCPMPTGDLKIGVRLFLHSNLLETSSS